MTYDIDARAKEKMHSLDRIIVLRPMEGKKVLSATGSVDNRLFTGENRLHAVFGVTQGFWYMKYDNGIVPPALQVQFTELGQLLDFVRNYFAKRNVEVVEVQD